MENLCPWPLEISAQSYIQLDLFCEGCCSQNEQREWEKTARKKTQQCVKDRNSNSHKLHVFEDYVCSGK